MTGTDLCENKPHLSRSYLNHLADKILSAHSVLHSRKQQISLPEILICLKTGEVLHCTFGYFDYLQYFGREAHIAVKT